MLKKMDKMKIKERLQYGYSMVIGLMVIITVCAIVGLFLVQGKMNSYINRDQAADTAVKNCRIETNTSARYIREMALSDDPELFKEYKGNVQEGMAAIEEALKDLKASDAIHSQLNQEYEDAIHSWMEMGDRIIGELESGNKEEGIRLIVSECTPMLREAVEIAKEIDAATNLQKEASISTVKGTIVLVIVIMVLILGLAVFTAMKVGNRIVDTIVVPLKEIEGAAIDLSRGNLHTEITYRNDDEIGKLAHALRSSIGRLWDYVEDIDRAMKEFSQGNFDVQANVEYRGDFMGIEDSFMHFEKNMADMVKNVQSVANQVTKASERISVNSTDLAEGASEQAGVTQELSATIENVSGQIDRNAKEAIDISQRVGQDLEYSNGKMQEMVESMNRIGESSSEISKIIATINEIASQTNLLALNASIEAARAGEAGKGFAVVADQVSLLAAQSAEAATESTTLIEESVRAVKSGMDTANETAEQLQHVVQGARTIIRKVNLIAEASKEQASAVEQINHGVDQINNVVQTNSETSEECAASSQEMTAQAESLRDLIRKFKVGKF